MVSQSLSKNDSWVNFARLIQRHPLIRRTLWQRQHGRCQVCEKELKLERFSIHHQDYDHTCKTARRVQIKGCRGLVPRCHDCHLSDLEACTDRLVALCRLCHRRLHAPFR